MFTLGLIKNLMICEKKLSLMLDSSQKNKGSINFFMISNLHWFIAFTRFPSTNLGFKYPQKNSLQSPKIKWGVPPKIG